MRLQGKIAIVSGGAQGLGLAIVHRLAQEGAVVHSLDIKESPLDKNKQDFESTQKIHTHQVDVTNENDVHAVIASLCANSAIDILVNNAAINLHPTDLVNTLPEHWERILSTNLTSIHLLSRHVIPRMSHGSTIINLGSILGFRGARQCAAYSATKGAVISLTKSMALDYAPRIRVNCVCPGAVSTEMFDQYVARTENPSAERQRIAEAIPMKRLGRPEDIANAVLFLACNEAEWITGATLVVDGGDSV